MNDEKKRKLTKTNFFSENGTREAYIKEAGKRDEGKKSGSPGQMRNKLGDLELGSNYDTRWKTVRCAKMRCRRTGS